MAHISTKDLYQQLDKNHVRYDQIIDIRTPAEYRSVHISGIKNIPMEQIPSHMNQLSKTEPLYLLCNSGNRSKMAISDLSHHGFNNLINVEGGIQAWMKDSFPVIRTAKWHMPVIRQVMTIAGALVLMGSLGSVLLNPNWIWLAVFVGCGLFFAGISGYCLMAKILEKMPWNQ